jgi:hypothetical protein
MNLTVRFIADRVGLRTEVLTRSVWAFVEECLDPVVMQLKEGPDLLLLFRSQLQVPR